MDVSAISNPSQITARNPKLLRAAQELEASFLSEILKSSGLASPSQAFGGGVGEQHFSTFLVREYASIIAENGGLGMAEAIYQSLLEGGTVK